MPAQSRQTAPPSARRPGSNLSVPQPGHRPRTSVALAKQVRQIGQTTEIKQDWTTGPSSQLAQRKAANSPAVDEHEGHGGMTHTHVNYTGLDRMVDIVALQKLVPPVLISPPNKKNPVWSARSDSQNRMLRVNLKLDAATGNIIERKDFSQRPLLDRIIGIGVSVHEGQLFGWFNQFLGVFTALGVITVAVSAVVLWWRRRPVNALGAPKAPNNQPLPVYLGVLVVALGTLLPLLGISLIAILFIEFIVLRRIVGVRNFLGISQ